VRQSLDCRGNCTAWPAPRRPEIDQHRLLALPNDLIECGIAESDWFTLLMSFTYWPVR
jgi:hypothetical protein